MSSSSKSPALLFARELQEAKRLILLLREELGPAASAIDVKIARTSLLIALALICGIN
jgi:hypothetical protein